MLLSKSGASYCNAFRTADEQRVCKNRAEISLQIMPTYISVAIYDQALERYLSVNISKKNIVKVFSSYSSVLDFQTVLDNLRLAIRAKILFRLDLREPNCSN